MPEPTIKLSSIFTTLDGEVTTGGPLQWSTFIRTGGCPLRCWKSSGFCDAPHTLSMTYPYKEVAVDDIIARVKRERVRRVTITGGEPMVQAAAVCTLARQLRDLGIHVSLETSGSVEMLQDHIDSFNCIVLDVKPPSTEMDRFMEWDTVERLRILDYVKAVVESRDDFDWFLTKMREHTVSSRIAIGPRMGPDGPMVAPAEIVEWMRESSLFHWRLNLQLHKYIWPKSVTLPLKTLKNIDPAEYIEKEV